ncbi:tripartite tricarboxylate transporter substrate binding protein [Variovorax dokdonensis]|uniref:Tripartite tricarboxylate transporter substrate binding protein n=1 Tax=Variovorax dokdonensis TaxID=344883 RepID=A0ABT7N532_9BURK|nr:tripartite tricarboxylate transporter substrate binding protein [Variovorax dokdonensis]MDM0043048.1 tripartite tricarboxylate transporter substrate binding protein [Variovorax dokdonensis]
MPARPKHGDSFRAQRRNVLRGGAAIAALAALPMAPRALAQQASGSFPSKVIRIVPFGTAGGPIDVIARVYGEKLQQRWGQAVIVEPKPGASGILASDMVAKAAPDGHTVLFTLPLTHINNAILQSKLPYDPVKDFEPISQLATGGPMLVARADAPYSNVKEFVAYAKKHPGMTYGTWGNGSQAHLMGELLKHQAHLELTHVAYKSESAAHNDMIGGVLDFAWANPSTARAQSQGGRMKALGIAGSRRVSTMPDVPTFAEQGFAGFDLDSWIGVYAPAKTPQPIIEQWTQALRDITRMPEVREKLINYGFEPLGSTPAEFKASYEADYPRVAELIKAAGVTAQ